MKKCGDLLDHINNIKVFAYQFLCLEVPMRNKNVAMILLKSLLSSYEHLITAMETLSMKEPIM